MSEHEAFYRYRADGTNYAFNKWSDEKKKSGRNFGQYKNAKAYEIKAGDIVLWKDDDMMVTDIVKPIGRNPFITATLEDSNGHTITEKWTRNLDVRRKR